VVVVVVAHDNGGQASSWLTINMLKIFTLHSFRTLA
jgi:hypothetical protein